eukprot:3065369-Prymnesium_polylepis.1
MFGYAWISGQSGRVWTYLFQQWPESGVNTCQQSSKSGVTAWCSNGVPTYEEVGVNGVNVRACVC